MAVFPITLCMLTLNEEDRLPASLGAVRGHVERTIVLDAESTDHTREVAAEHGAEVVVRAWAGYVDARRHLLGLADSPWVLMIDADEVLQPDFWTELEAGGFPDVDADGFQLRRRTVYLGKKLRRAFQPDWKTVLFRGDAAYLEDGAVHEAVQVKGRLERMSAEIEHHSYRSLEEHYERMRRYARLSAEEMHEAGRRATWFDLRVRPAWRWFTELLVRGAIVDGRRGWMVAKSSADSVRLRFELLRDLERGSRPGA